MKTINKQSRIPYDQLAEILRATIHESVPSENEQMPEISMNTNLP